MMVLYPYNLITQKNSNNKNCIPGPGKVDFLLKIHWKSYFFSSHCGYP